MMGRIRGLELQFNLVQKQLQTKDDCVVVALHCILINEDLQCVGTGDDWPVDSALLRGSELLPSNWNSNPDVYSLRYATRDLSHRYLLKVVKAGQSMHVNVALNEKKSATVSVKTSEVVGDDYSTYSEAFLDLDLLVKNFKENVLMKLSSGSKASPETSKKQKHPGPDSGNERPSSPGRPNRPDPDFNRPTAPPSRPFPDFGRSPFPRIGGQDLDPFGRAEGGMLFDPRIPPRPSLGDFGVGIPGGLPRGSVPPGARFDPIGPFMPGGPRFNPNPDHFRPPDNDDYFM